MTTLEQQTAWPVIDAAGLRADRWSRVQAMMRRLGLDHLVLTAADDIRYVTDFRSQLTPESHQWFAAAVNLDGACELFVPYVDTDIADPLPDNPAIRTMRAAPAWAPNTLHPLTWARLLGAVLSRDGARRIGHRGLPASLLAALNTAVPNADWQPVDSALDEIRREKLPAEIELLTAVNHVNSRAAEAAIEAGVAGASDYDFLAAAASYQMRAGVEYLSHSVCNVRKQSGDWFAYGVQLREGDTFMFDIGCYGRGGYASDLARVGFVGEPPKVVANAYKLLLEAHHVGEETARPGVLGSHIDAAVNRYLERHRLPTTPYAMGHGVGLQICESPTIYRPTMLDVDAPLRVGDVIALEPETAVEVDGHLIVLKVEDNYLVEPNGLRRLSDAGY
jgi:Xaa-Pro aminopeptidase